MSQDNFIFTCPFCHGECLVTDARNGEKKYVVVMHGKPTCEVFESLEPTVYLERCLDRMHQIN